MGKFDNMSSEELNEALNKIVYEHEDNINHPKHYETDKVECIEAMEITQGRGAVMSFCLCNAFKYLWRHGRKNGVEDIKKARWYLDKYIELAEKDSKEWTVNITDEDLSEQIKKAFGIVDLDTLDIFRDAEHIKPIFTDDMRKSESSSTMEESIIKSFAREPKDVADAIRNDEVLSDAAKEELLKNLSDGELENLFNADYGNGRDA